MKNKICYEKPLFILSLLLSTIGIKAQTVTLLYNDGTQKQITASDDIYFQFLCIGSSHTNLTISASSFHHEKLNEKEKEEIKRLAKEIGDGTVEQKEEFGTTTCSVSLENTIRGITIDK